MKKEYVYIVIDTTYAVVYGVYKTREAALKKATNKRIMTIQMLEVEE